MICHKIKSIKCLRLSSFLVATTSCHYMRPCRTFIKKCSKPFSCFWYMYLNFDETGDFPSEIQQLWIEICTILNRSIILVYKMVCFILFDIALYDFLSNKLRKSSVWSQRKKNTTFPFIMNFHFILMKNRLQY